MSDAFATIEPLASAACTKAMTHGFDALTEAERTLFLVWIATGEADNGGLHAIRYNSTGDYIRHFPTAFEAIGATTLERVFADLRRIADEAPLASDHDTRVKQHSALTRRIVSRINALVERYLSAKDDVLALLASYLQLSGNL